MRLRRTLQPPLTSQKASTSSAGVSLCSVGTTPTSSSPDDVTTIPMGTMMRAPYRSMATPQAGDMAAERRVPSMYIAAKKEFDMPWQRKPLVSAAGPASAG